MRMLVGSTLGSDMAVGLSIVSGGSYKAGISVNVELLRGRSKMSMVVSSKLIGVSSLDCGRGVLDMSGGSVIMAGVSVRLVGVFGSVGAGGSVIFSSFKGIGCSS